MDTQPARIEFPVSMASLSALQWNHGERDILLLHADAGAATQWAAAAALLPAILRATALDFPGHGESGADRNGDYSLAARAQAAAAAIAALHLRRPTLAGHSGGALVALAMFAADPAAFSGLVLIDPPGDPAQLPADVRSRMRDGIGGPDGLAWMETFYRSIAGKDPAVQTRIIEDARHTIEAARVGVTRAYTDWDASALADFTGPLLVIAREGGPAASAQLPAGAQRISIAGVGHWLHLERPSLVAALIAFAAGQGASQPA